MKLVKHAICCATALCASAAWSQPASQPDWGQRLRQDAQALAATYRRDHPGSVDDQNVAFRDWLERGLAQALARAEGAQEYGHYWWAMREYVAGFNDGHVFLEQAEGAPRLPLRWPGFLTRQVDGVHIVASRADDAALPPLGARLVACDGTPSTRLAADLIGRFRGRWDLESQQEAHGWRLFLDAANPFVRLPRSCLFSDGAREQSVQLNWRELSPQEFDQRSRALAPSADGRVEMRTFNQRDLWLTLGSFSSEQGSDAYRALEQIVGNLTRDSARLRMAEVIVLDVRGNGGGSSAWGERIAAALWGEGNARSAKPQSEGVDWRASEANAAAIEAFGNRSGGRTRLWASHIASGIRRAERERRAFWRETPVLGGLIGALLGGGRRHTSINPREFVTRARVYVLTDSGCASACLDAMDVWTRLGATPVGRQTSADSLYLEIRRETLPSRLAAFSIPMKVYRGRPRGANQPYRPAHKYSGDMRDREALEAWILSLR